MFGKLQKLLDSILDIILPLFCVSCGAYGTILCDTCYRSIPLIAKKIDKPTKNLDFILIVTKYEDPIIKSAIKGLKYQGLRSLAKPLGKLLYQTVEIHHGLDQDTVIVPVPLHTRKQKLRNYNQSFLLAKELGDSLHKNVDTNLHRTRYTVSQSKLTREERLKNVENVFKYGAPRACLWYHRNNPDKGRTSCRSRTETHRTHTRPKPWCSAKADKGKQAARAVLLLDDVTTTFATLDEAARAMKKHGSRRVGAIVIAKNDI